jgi:hypothetical protein
LGYLLFSPWHVHILDLKTILLLTTKLPRWDFTL